MLKQPCFPSISPSKGKLNSVSQSETRDPEQSCNEDSPKILEEPSVKCLLLVVNLYQLSTTLGLDPVSSHENLPFVYPESSYKIMNPVSAALQPNLQGIFVATLTQKESEIANGFNEEPSETVKIVSDYQVCLTARQDSITFQNSIKGVVKGGKLIQNISFEKSLISLEFTKILSD